MILLTCPRYLQRCSEIRYSTSPHHTVSCRCIMWCLTYACCWNDSLYPRHGATEHDLNIVLIPADAAIGHVTTLHRIIWTNTTNSNHVARWELILFVSVYQEKQLLWVQTTDTCPSIDVNHCRGFLTAGQTITVKKASYVTLF